MLDSYYDPEKTHPAKKDILAVDEKTPDFTFEYAMEFQKSMQQQLFLKPEEQSIFPSPNCMSWQTNITLQMRRVLVDWLVEVHLNFKLLPETLFITISLIDRYCERKQVKRSDFQLVGVACMLIATKYEEIYPPFIKDFIFITDSAYNKQQILEQELDILTTLDFNLTFPTSLRFLERYAKLAEADPYLFSLSKYMVELSLVEVSMNKWNPSLLASSALYVAKKILQRNPPWSHFMMAQTTHSQKEVHKCAKEICIIINLAHQKKYFKAIFKKYSSQANFEVSQVCKNLSETICQATP